MRPISITLTGFKGFRAGVGLETVSLDLTQLPAGLVAIAGSNGMGKTTLLDNLHPYRIMPYKLRESKEWTPGAFSYYDQCYGRDAKKEFVFEIGGKRYKSVIMIDAERRKQECYLFMETFDGWVPYNSAVKDGKTREYDLAIEELLGSPSLFFSSVFRSQDARKLSSYPRSEILSIVCELLNIDHIKAQGEKANKVSSALEAMVDDLEKQRSPMLAAIERLEELKASEDNTKFSIVTSEKSLSTLRGDLTSQETAAHDLELANAAQAVSKQRLAEMRGRHSEVLGDITKANNNKQIQEYDAELLRIDAESKQADATLEADTAALETEHEQERSCAGKALADIEQKHIEAKAILARADEINQAVTRESELENALSLAKEDLEGARAHAQGLQTKVQTATKLNGELKTVLAEISAEQGRVSQRKATVQAEIDRCQKQTGYLAGLDCKADGSGWVNEACPLLTDAVSAKATIANLETELASLQGISPKEQELNAQRLSVEAQLSGLATAQADLDACVSAGKAKVVTVGNLEKELADTRKTAQLIFEIDNAETRVKELAEQAKTVTEQVAQKTVAIENKIVEITDRAEARQAEFTQRRTEVTLKRVQCEVEAAQVLAELQSKADTLAEDIRQLEATLSGDMERELEAIQNAIANIKTKVATEEGLIKGLHAQLGGIQAQLTDLEQKKTALTKIDTEIAKINEEAVNWRLLARACSNDGIVALEIDDAGPSISALTNDLLQACYGPRFTVRFETQAAKNDGGLKEVFDITIFDAERDEEKSIRDMSGGEVLYLEDSITRAFCLFNLNRSERKYETLFTDEKDGALDQGRKLEFLSIKRRALEIGTHDREFFISQTEELQDMADARIILKKGSVTIA